MKNDRMENIFTSVEGSDSPKYIEKFISLVLSENGENVTVMSYFGILACACKLEGIFEAYVTSWCQSEKLNQTELVQRILFKIGNDVSKSTGIDSWKEWFDVLFNLNLKKLFDKKWDSVSKLFEFRNKLAHGRASKLNHCYKEDGKFIGVSINGSTYERIINFLIDKRVINPKEDTVFTFSSFVNQKVVEFFKNEVDQMILILERNKSLKNFKRYSGSSYHEIKSSINPSDLDIVSKCIPDSDE